MNLSDGTDEEFSGAHFCWPCTCCNRCGRMTDKFKCPVCQTELEKDATVCPKCGSPVMPKPGQGGAGLAAPKAPAAPSAIGDKSGVVPGFK